MALIKCPECGKEISDTAKSCPNCGYEEIQDYKVQNHSLRYTILIILGVLVIILIAFITIVSKRENEDEYTNNLAAKVCSIHNYTDAVINTIESTSSLEWYLEVTDKPQDEALKTYGLACQSALKENHGLYKKELEPVEYTGKKENIKQACDMYTEMYNEYNNFCELIANPYVPANAFISDVYAKANHITDLYAEISNTFDGDIEDDYASNDVDYGIYYRNKDK